MRPEDLINQAKSGPRITDEQQINFDAQCFKEFATSVGYHPSWSKMIGSGQDGSTPWMKMEEELGLTLPFYVIGRRVDKFNILSLAMGKVKSELVEAFADACELAEAHDRPAAMIFKYSGDKRSGIAGTKLVYVEYDSVVSWLNGGDISGVVVRSTAITPAGVIIPYKGWREELMKSYGYIFE